VHLLKIILSFMKQYLDCRAETNQAYIYQKSCRHLQM